MANTKDTRIVDWKDMKKTMEASTIPGSSLAGTQLSLLMKKSYDIVCGMVVQNWTHMELSLPQVTVNTGILSKPPVSVSPGQREAVIAHKYGFSIMGTSGLMSWSLNELERRVVVMWNVPFFTSANNLVVGITTKGSTVHSDAWYTKIELLSESPDLNVKRGKYYETCNEIMIEDDCIQVLGTMGNGRKPEVWLIGNVIPIFKDKGSKSDPKNYRPITLLSCIGKIVT